MTCRHCKHSLQSHEKSSCRMTIATGWDEAAGKFTGERHCACPGYEGPRPSAEVVDRCPHELQTHGPHPDTCVHCGTTVVRNK